MSDLTAADAADDQFRIVARSEDAGVLVVAGGEIDLANADRFRAVLTAAAEPSRALTVDMTRVDYCDSAAIHALFASAEKCALTVLISPAGPLTRLFAISSLNEVATIQHAS